MFFFLLDTIRCRCQFASFILPYIYIFLSFRSLLLLFCICYLCECARFFHIDCFIVLRLSTTLCLNSENIKLIVDNTSFFFTGFSLSLLAAEWNVERRKKCLRWNKDRNILFVPAHSYISCYLAKWMVTNCAKSPINIICLRILWLS